MDRRTALVALSGFPLAASAAVAAAANPREFDFERYVRLHWAPRGEWALWVYAGLLMVKPEGQVAQPLARVRGISFSRAALGSDGAADHELEEVGYYCDLKSGEPLTTLRNPFTDRDVKVSHYRTPQKLRFAGARITPSAALPPGVEFRGEVDVLADLPGLVSMTEDLYVRMPEVPARDGAPARPARFAASLATLTAREADFRRGRDSWIDATLAYGTMNSFVGWLGMDGMPGVQSMRLAGIKHRVSTLERVVPADLLARMRRDHPDFLERAFQKRSR